MILSGWEAVFFWVFSIAAIFAGLLTVMARNTIHSALFLISSLVSVAALFILLHAEFIAGVQILVYVGGVMVLFPLRDHAGQRRLGRARPRRDFQPAAPGYDQRDLLCLAGRWTDLRNQCWLRRISETRRSENPSSREQSQSRGPGLATSATGSSRITDETERVGNSLYRYGSLPFEIASVLLLVAIIGSVMLARTLKQEAAVDDVAPEVLQKEAAHDPELAEVKPESVA